MSHQKKNSAFFSNARRELFWKIAFSLIVAVLFGLLVYQANENGITHDETHSWQHFSKDVYTARHNYQNVNNHVLNSIFICYARKICGDYEHYIRIFPILSSLLYFLSVAYILKSCLKNLSMRLVAFIFIITVPFVFVYLYLARGYTYGLSAMSLYIAVVFYFMNHPIRLRYWPVPVIILSLINFYSLASMISSIFCLFSLNAVFVLFYSNQIFTGQPRRVVPILINSLAIAALSAGLLYLFYHPILDDILNASTNPSVAHVSRAWKGWDSFATFIQNLLVRRVFYVKESGVWRYYAFVLLVCAGLVSLFIRFFKSWKQHKFMDSLRDQRHGIFLFLFFISYMILLFVFGVILKKSPGLPRSQMFLIPSMLLASMWCLDNLISNVSMRFWKNSLLCSIILIFLSISLSSFPRLLRYSRTGFTMSRQTLQKLENFDPNLTWRLCFSKKMRNYLKGFQYYQQFDHYKFTLGARQYANVIIYRPDELPEKPVCIDYNYFMDYHNCVVVLLRPLETETIFEITPKK